jgi:hypothetical protein
MNSLVAPHGGLDQLLDHGADTALIAERREHVENELPTLQRELRAIGIVSLERTDVSKGLPTVPDQPLKHEAYVGEVPASQAPACLYILGLNDCFLDWYSTVDYHGSGTVYQSAAGVFHHNTSTTIWDNGSQIGIPKTTANFGLQPTWSSPYSFSPSDPNCFNADHNITETTSHHISLGITDVGLAEGSQESNDHSQCFRKYLTVSLSPATISVGANATVSVGHLPSGICGLSISGSNADVASTQDYGNGILAATGLEAGTASITAKCSDGTSGSAVLTVKDDQCNLDPATSVGRLHALDCSSTPPSGGGAGDDSDCGWYEWEISFDGGVTWEPDGAPFWYCPGGGEAATAIGRGTGATSRPAASDSTYQISLFGTSLPGSQTVMAYRDFRGHHEPIVVVDTSRATATELEAVLQALSEVATFAPSDTRATGGRLQSQATPGSLMAKGREASEDAKLLRDLAKSPITDVDGLGQGRLMQASVGRPSHGSRGKP